MSTPRATSIALLRAAFLTGPDAVDAAATWLAETHLEHLPPDQYPLLPLVLPAVEQAAAHHPWLERLRGVYHRAWYANQLVLRVAARLVQALDKAGAPALLADGASLVLTAYGSRLRPIDALTLIVPVEFAAVACEVLLAQGGQPLTPGGDWSGRGEVWLTGQRWRLPETHLIDLHWHVAPFWPSNALDLAAWERARPIILPDHATVALGNSDQLVRACYTATLPGPAALVALADAAALLLASHGEQAEGGKSVVGQTREIDWDAVLHIAVTGHIGRALRTTLEFLGTTLNIGAPPDIMARLRALPLSSFESIAGRGELPTGAHIGGMRAARMLVAQYHRAAVAGSEKPAWGPFLTFVQQRWGLSRPRQIFGEMIVRLRR